MATDHVTTADRIRRIRVAAESQGANLRELKGVEIDRDDMIALFEQIEDEADAALAEPGGLTQGESGAAAPVSMAAERLALLQRVCRNIAGDIDTARTVLRGGAEEANTAYLVADALDRIGWMAERAFRIAGDTDPGHAGNADGWMFGPDAQGDIARVLPVEVNHG